MIGPHMALPAGVWKAGHLFGEGVAGMARTAGTEASIQIDPPDSRIGPGGWIDERPSLFAPLDFPLLVFQDGNRGTVALLATVNGGRHPFNDLTKHIIERAQNPTRLGMVAFGKFLGNVGVAPTAVGRRNDDG